MHYTLAQSLMTPSLPIPSCSLVNAVVAHSFCKWTPLPLPFAEPLWPCLALSSSSSSSKENLASASIIRSCSGKRWNPSRARLPHPDRRGPPMKPSPLPVILSCNQPKQFVKQSHRTQGIEGSCSKPLSPRKKRLYSVAAMKYTKKATRSLPAATKIRIVALGEDAMREGGTYMAEKSASEWMMPAPLSPVGQAAWEYAGQTHSEDGCRRNLHLSAIPQRTSNLRSLQAGIVQ